MFNFHFGYRLFSLGRTFSRFNGRLSKKSAFHSFLLLSFAVCSWKKYSLANQASTENMTFEQKLKIVQNEDAQMKKILEVEVCYASEIKEGKTFPVTVKNIDGTDYNIQIIKYRNKFYAVGGECTFKDEFDLEKGEQKVPSLENAICFNDKLMCPHHGCCFDLKSGTVEYGPAKLNLPIFSVQQKGDKVYLFYPEKIPKAVTPRTVQRNYNDTRKVVILGDDHNASIGCIDGLRQFGYEGEISIVMDKQVQTPYDKSKLHKSLINLKLKDKYKKIPSNIEKTIEQELEEKVFKKLQFHNEQWFTEHGIDFTYSSEPYRIIHKRYYPYLTFFDGKKQQYDGLVINTDCTPKVDILPGITTADQRGKERIMPQNVFMPFRNKKQYSKMVKFLNTYEVKNMVVYGLDQFTLEFLHSMKNEFPQVNITVIDPVSENKLYQYYGEDITHRILKEYTNRGIQFYLRMTDPIESKNSLAQVSLESLDRVRKSRVWNSSNIRNSIQLKFGSKQFVQNIDADCFVYFPEEYRGNTENIRKKQKYTSLEFTPEGRIKTQPNMKTDNSRIFSTGTASATEHFFTRSLFHTFNPLVAYEEGMCCAFNLLALNIPFAYVPVEITKHFGKKLYHAGSQNYFNRMVVLGSIENWDFLAFHAFNEKIYSVTASESRQREFQVIRQAFRLHCQPQFSSLVNNEWPIPKIQKLIQKLNKSYCYRDEIHKVEDDPISKLVIWIEREKGAGYANDRPQSEDFSSIEIDQRGYPRGV